MFDLEFIKLMAMFGFLYVIGLGLFSLRMKRGNKPHKIDNRVFEKIIINNINNMTGQDFESFCTFVFGHCGYIARQTKATNDGGKDIKLLDKSGYTYVECKRYESSNLIGRELCQKLVGSAVGDGVKKCIFVTTSDFNKNAIEYAKNIKGGIKLQLINLEEFLKMVQKIDQDSVMNYLGSNYECLKVAK